MVQKGQITLYTNPVTPLCHRVHIALHEAHAEYTEHYVPVPIPSELEWFSEVNPLRKIPTLTYGGPTTSPDRPSAESAKLTESAALVQFVADIFPESGLVPADPVLRARARAFIMWIDLKFFNAYSAFFIKGESASVLLDAIKTLQDLLPPEGFAIGQWSIADAALAPFMPRIQLFLANDIGIYPVGEGPKTLKALQEPLFARFRKYAADVGERPSVKDTFDAAKTLAEARIIPFLVRDRK